MDSRAAVDVEGGIAMIAAVAAAAAQMQRENLDCTDRVIHETAVDYCVLLGRVVRKSGRDLERSQVWLLTSSWNVYDVLVVQGSFLLMVFQGHCIGRSE